MNQSEIIAFLQVVQQGTISGAAKVLYMSQPALSRRINALEEEIGCELIVRSKGQRIVELTEAGQGFVSLAKRWLELLDESHALKQQKHSPSLRMGLVGSVCNLLLPKVFESFIQCFPECRLHVYQHHSTECYQHMETGNLDVALISDDVYSKTVETVPIFKSKFYLLHRVKHERALIPPAELNTEQEIRLPWTPEFDLWHDYWFGSIARPKIVLDQMPLLEHFLTQTDNWAIAPAYVVQTLVAKQPSIHVYQLTEPPPEEIVYYLLPKDAHKINSYGQEFLQLMAQTLLEQHPEVQVLL